MSDHATEVEEIAALLGDYLQRAGLSRKQASGKPVWATFQSGARRAIHYRWGSRDDYAVKVTGDNAGQLLQANLAIEPDFELIEDVTTVNLWDWWPSQVEPPF